MMKDVIESLKEINTEQYEHIEQSVEFEEVMGERIDELKKIVAENEEQEEDDEEEFLSFFKGGVPHDQRSYFYEIYEVTFLSFASKGELSSDQKKTKKYLKSLIETDMNEFLNSHEFFIFEAPIKKMISMFIKKYITIISKPNNESDSILKIPFKGFIKFFGLAAFTNQDINATFKFFEVVYHKVNLIIDFVEII